MNEMKTSAAERGRWCTPSQNKMAVWRWRQKRCRTEMEERKCTKEGNEIAENTEAEEKDVRKIMREENDVQRQ